MAIPDLLEIPHVQLDHTSQIIYYNVLIHGFLLDPEYQSEKDAIVRHLYRISMALMEGWLDEIKNTPADLIVAFFMVSMHVFWSPVWETKLTSIYQVSITLDGSNSELSWKFLGHACAISRALGYFTIDANQAEGKENEKEKGKQGEKEPTEHEAEIDKNRIRFEFWHLLRTDCLFRLSFGKPALIPRDSWKVNFPDPTITGVDNASTRFIQIHFLASMRLTLIMLKYLDMEDADAEHELDTVVYDTQVDGLIEEVQLIMSDWNAVSLNPSLDKSEKILTQ